MSKANNALERRFTFPPSWIILIVTAAYADSLPNAMNHSARIVENMEARAQIFNVLRGVTTTGLLGDILPAQDFSIPPTA